MSSFFGQTSPADNRATQFNPVAGGETQSGEKLLTQAYAAFWIVAFVFVLLSWRRQKKIDERVTSLEAAVAKARREATKGAD